MRKAMALGLLVAAAGLSACGDKGGGGGGGGGAAGTWTVDKSAMVDMAMAESKKHFASLPEDQRRMAESMMPSREVIAKQLEAIRFELVLKSDGTATGTVAGLPGEQDSSVVGTWTQSGDKVTITPKSKDGKPAEGEDAEPKTLTYRDGKLFLEDKQMTLAFVRK